MHTQQTRACWQDVQIKLMCLVFTYISYCEIIRSAPVAYCRTTACFDTRLHLQFRAAPPARSFPRECAKCNTPMHLSASTVRAHGWFLRTLWAVNQQRRSQGVRDSRPLAHPTGMFSVYIAQNIKTAETTEP